MTSAASASSAVAHDLPDLGMACDGRDHAVDTDLPDRAGDVGAVDEDPPGGVERDRLLPRQGAERLAVAEVDPAPEREPGEAPVHRAGVQVAEPEPLREAACHGALTGPGRAVDGNDHPGPEG